MKKQLLSDNRILYVLLLLVIFNSYLFSQSELRIISPNGGEILQAGSYQSIVWVERNIKKINVSYSVDNGSSWIPIYKEIGTKLGVISWKIPNLIGSNIVIKINDVNGDKFDVSDSYFTISSDFSLKGSIKKLTKTNSTTVIMPLGNSITYDNRVIFNGISPDPRSVGERTGYRVPLYNLLTDAGYNFDFTGSEHAGGNYLPAGYDDNAGFPGIGDDELANLLITGRRVQTPNYDYQITPGPYLNIYPADIILLHIGTNGNQKSDGTDPADAEKILDEIKRYEDSTGTEITVILARIINRSPNETFVTDLNDNVEAMALDRVNNPANDAYPDKIIVVDMEDSAGIDYSISPDPNGGPGNMNDLYHPNDLGYAKMAQVWFKALQKVLPGKPIITLQPESISTIIGSTVEFSVDASGSTPLNYQWQKNSSSIQNTNSSTLQLNNVSIDEDSSLYRCIVSNSYGADTSQSAMLIVAGSNDRVNFGLELLYTFDYKQGSTILDKSEKSPIMDIEINDTNNIAEVPYGLEINDNNILFSNDQPTKLFESLTQSNEFTIEAWLVPKNLTQTGPARIITFSNDGSNRNFTLAQDGDKYLTRLRTTSTDNNGQPEFSTSAGAVDTSLTHLVFIRKIDGSEMFYINGILSDSQIVGGDFSNWDSTYSFGLTNEFNLNRSWIGKLYLVGVYSRALSEPEIIHNYNAKFNGFNKLLFTPSNLIALVENDTNVVLSWNDNESQELGYLIERKANLIDSIFIPLDSVNANSTQYTDNHPKYTTSYFYRVKAYNNIFESDYTDSVIVNNIISGVNIFSINDRFRLSQNYPNPFNPTTTITFSIPETANISLIIYNTLGEKVADKINNLYSPGNYSFDFDASKLPSGIYIYSLRVNGINGKNFTSSKKMILLK